MILFALIGIIGLIICIFYYPGFIAFSLLALLALIHLNGWAVFMVICGAFAYMFFRSDQERRARELENRRH